MMEEIHRLLEINITGLEKENESNQVPASEQVMVEIHLQSPSKPMKNYPNWNYSRYCMSRIFVTRQPTPDQGIRIGKIKDEDGYQWMCPVTTYILTNREFLKLHDLVQQLLAIYGTNPKQLKVNKTAEYQKLIKHMSDVSPLTEKRIKQEVKLFTIILLHMTGKLGKMIEKSRKKIKIKKTIKKASYIDNILFSARLK